MKKILKFIDSIHKEKDQLFGEKIKEFQEKYSGTDHFNGDKLSIENQSDFFLYLSEDKKIISSSWDDFNPKIEYSYLIYFVFYHHKAVYTNGGLQFIGFYDSEFNKKDAIPMEKVKIVEAKTWINFNNLKYPTFSLCVEHKYGNTHSTFYAEARDLKRCQKALDSVWEIEEFYKRF